MSRMLSLPLHVWALARRVHTQNPLAAERYLQRVLDVDLTDPERVELFRMQADQCLYRENYRHARKYLKRAMQLLPNDALLVIRLAQAWENDPYGSDRQAARYFRRATRLAPLDALAWASLGRACLRIGKDAIAKRATRHALKLAPDRADVLTVAVEMLRESGRLKSALKYVRNAWFSKPHDPAIKALMHRIQFEIARSQQSAHDQRSSNRVSATLPFVRIIDAEGVRRTVRVDEPETRYPVSLRIQFSG